MLGIVSRVIPHSDRDHSVQEICNDILLNHDFSAQSQPHEHHNREPVFAFPVRLIIEVHIHEMETVVNDIIEE